MPSKERITYFFDRSLTLPPSSLRKSENLLLELLNCEPFPFLACQMKRKQLRSGRHIMGPITR